MSMQTIEPFGGYEEEWKIGSRLPRSTSPRAQAPAHSVTLKDGIDLTDLQSGTGVQFEVDLEAPLPGGGGHGEEGDSPDGEEVDRESFLQQLNMESLGLRGEGGSDSDQEDSPFQLLALSMEDLSGDGGVLKKMLHMGTGEDVPVKAMVRVHYNGYLEYADEPYDSSRLRGKQQQFVLGNGEVIPGWEVAVKSMRRNERSQFLISPDYAFGKIGCPPRIPPNATILFEIELLGFVEYSGPQDVDDLREHQRNITFEQRLAAANSEREVGNDLFQQNMIGRAVGRYLKAVRQLEAVRLGNEEEEAVWRTALKKLYLNLSLCSLRQRKSQLAISNCRRVLELDSKNVKAFFRIGRAYLQLGDFKNSRKYLEKANKFSPQNKEIQLELRKMESTRQRFQSMERTLYSNMFQQPTREAYEEQEKSVPFHSRDLLMRKLKELKENPSLLDVVLPQGLSEAEVFCAEEVARELGLRTEKRPECGLRVVKPGVQPEDFEQYLR